MPDATALPYVTADVPGVGGVLRRFDDDFCVEEVPAYGPSGAGDHVLAWIEKRGLSTFDAIRVLAGALGVSPDDVGSAGLKDKHAVTRQQLSFPPPVTPEALLAISRPGLQVHSAARHPHKLRTGHLRGNRFAIRLRDCTAATDEAAARAAAVLARLAEPPGSPNWFGAQRFGARGDNADVGAALLRGEKVAQARGRERRLYISAFQSAIFNEYLRRRIVDDCFRRVLGGELLQKTETGGLFASTDTEVDQVRFARGEVVPTGPMFGHKMRAPPEGSEAAGREAALLAERGIAPADFRKLGALAEGTRRALAVPVGAASAQALDDGAVELRFELPAGAYATAILREVVKGERDFPE